MCYMNCPNENSSGACRKGGNVSECPHERTDSTQFTLCFEDEETGEKTSVKCDIALDGNFVNISYVYANGYSTDKYTYEAEFETYAEARKCFEAIDEGDDLDYLTDEYDFKLS